MSEKNPVLNDFPDPCFNAFIMMRFRETDTHRAILDALSSSLAFYGINALRADQRSYCDSLWGNVRFYIEACDLGIAVFEQLDDKDFNPNVSLELGYMMARRKKFLLLKEASLPSLPTDIVGNLYHTFSRADVCSSIDTAIRRWLRDIGIAKSPAEKLVLFVSYGGTCRCAMAKVILEQLLQGRQLPYRLRVESIAHKFGSTGRASKGARRAVEELFGRDLLKAHRVTHQNPGLLADADLILPMDADCAKNLPPDKTILFNRFFGRDGEVPNPWPDKTPDAHDKYKHCIQHLHSTLSPGLETLLTRLANETNAV